MWPPQFILSVAVFKAKLALYFRLSCNNWIQPRAGAGSRNDKPCDSVSLNSSYLPPISESKLSEEKYAIEFQ